MPFTHLLNFEPSQKALNQGNQHHYILILLKFHCTNNQTFPKCMYLFPYKYPPHLLSTKIQQPEISISSDPKNPEPQIRIQDFQNNRIRDVCTEFN